MFHLTKQQETERDEIAKRLRDAYDELCGAANAFNAVAGEARDFAEAIASDARSAYDEKSERWQQSEAATDADEWIRNWEELELPDAEEYDEAGVDSFENIESNRPMPRKRAPKAAITGPGPGVEGKVQP